MPSDVDDFWSGLQKDLDTARQLAAPYLDVVHSVNAANNAARLKDGGAGSASSELFPRVAGGPLAAGDTVVVARRSNGKRVILGKLDDGAGDALATAAALAALDTATAAALALKASSTHTHLLGSAPFARSTRSPTAGGTFNQTASTGTPLGSLVTTLSDLVIGKDYLTLIAGGLWMAPATDGNAVEFSVRLGTTYSQWVGHNKAAGAMVPVVDYIFFNASSASLTLQGYCRNTVSASNPVGGGFIFALAIPWQGTAPQ